jgi:hypothetical protein
MTINLAAEDFKRLKNILKDLPDFLIEANRVGFLLNVLQSSPRRSDILGAYTISGPGDGAAVRLISWLCQFGQDKPGRESLALLVDALLDLLGETSEDGIFLCSLYKRYPLFPAGQPILTQATVIVSLPQLTPQQEGELSQALLDAFTFRSLERMLWYELGKDLEAIRLGHSDLSDVVFHLHKTAQREGWMSELISAAHAANPGNSKLNSFITSLTA